MENGTIGFAPHTVSDKTTLWDATLPSSTLSSTKTMFVANSVSWVIVTLIFGGLVAVFYFFVHPMLEDEFPNNVYYMIGLSFGYFTVVFIILVYVIRRLLILIMTVSPNHGGIATHKNQKLLTIGTLSYLALALWVYSILIRSFKAKLAAKKEVVTGEDEKS